MNTPNNFIKKYNVAGPRYTSYPTVPYWNNIPPKEEEWKINVRKSFDESNLETGISLYIHLPFCESLCTYCGCNTRITVNHSVEEKYILALLNEWNLYLEIFGSKPVIKEIHLGGGTPTFFSPKNLKTLIDGITSTSRLHLNYEFSFEAHPNNTTKDHLLTLYQLGFRRLSLGIQDFDPKVQQIVNRVQSFETVSEIVKQARYIGYNSINFDLIYGLPLQTKQSVANTIDLVNRLKPDRIAYYSYAHVPWLKPGQRKFTEKDLPLDEEKRTLYEIGKTRFIENGYQEVGMDHFALKSDTLNRAAKNGTLHRNFMGYTHNKTQLMIGLGVSSISDTWYAFAQNVKTVEQYYDLVNNNQIPIFKGHVLSEEDLILRKHILNLICKFKTAWHSENEQCEALYDAIERLVEMKKDRLIELQPYELNILKHAIPFVRNVCMAFDARLWRNIPQSKIFSSVV
jgi:oxygen-independent coproporphyrinogen-3 oxidase